MGFLVNITGKDAADFLDRLSSNAVKTLAVDQSQKGAFLDGKASIIALFLITKKSEEAFEIHIADAFKDPFLNHIDKMLFGEDVKVDVSESDFLKNSGHPFDRLPHDVPVNSEFLAESMVLDAALDEVIDRDKGCYPGQEVVEKIYSYGRRPKALVRLEPVDTSPKVGDEVFEGASKIGRVVKSYALENGKNGVVAIVRRAKAQAGLSVTLKASNIQTKIRDSVE